MLRVKGVFSVERVILHSDLNAFYASVEMMLDPRLRGTAMAVCGSTELRHGIVLAKSELAKKAGVKTGMVNYEARQKCPGLIIVPPQHEQYEKYSKLVRAIYGRYTDMVEPYGIDEAWLDVTGSTRLLGSGQEIAEDIRQTVKRELGLTVSVGVSFNKVLAKLASDMRKPDAVTVLDQETWKEKVWPMPVSDLLFCGRASTRKLIDRGILTIGALAQLSPDTLRNWFGVNGLGLWVSANGEDRARVMHRDYVSPVKSVGHGDTCVVDLKEGDDVWKVMLELSQDLGRRLRYHGLSATGVQLAVKDSKLFTKQYQGPLPAPSQSPYEIAQLARNLFARNYRWTEPVRALTVRAINLVPRGQPVQLDMFDDATKRLRREKLEDTIYDIRRRFGQRAVISACLMGDLKMGTARAHETTLPGMMYQ